ncbi:uncharacterized protein [Zea mays]|uniref:DUF7731 domain-containing protein n=1 Tax=Zea mays TaxID=4577 RepID=A0A804Q1X6_MAIZE|nr:uncharacterized protein LOC103630242 [Zea mays]ONM63103.1 Glycine-rich protein family [Zea mays]|eukprot:XP_020401901.1 uncharacterized protein LOC103630242 [Zea mays]
MALASQRSVRLLVLAQAFAICMLIPCCSSSKEAMELFERACHCFDNPNIYSQCAEEFRLNAEGAFHVQRNEVDEYCGGPCLEETNLALECVEEVAAESFRFSNGASVLAVRQALGTGCSYGPDRGTFEIRERKDCVGGADEYYYRKPRDHEQEKPAVGGRYYGEGSQQPYEQQGAGGYGEGEEYCSGAAGRLGGERRGYYLQTIILLLLASAPPLILTL